MFFLRKFDIKTWEKSLEEAVLKIRQPYIQVYACYPWASVNSAPFHSQKFPGLGVIL